MTDSPVGVEDDLPLLETPAGGVPAVISTEEHLHRAAARLAAGTGPVSVDAERASGIRYGQRAFLAQFKRDGAGIILVDTETLRVAGADFTPLAEALTGPEWILHSALQDLPCLADLGLHPASLFDTELAARLAGFPRVGLGAVVERTLGIRLAKEHSNSDWSQRPLPLPWLTYAALDVEILAGVREALVMELAVQGKLEWAYQEFQHLMQQRPPEPRKDPWRRTSGLNTVKNRRGLSMAKSLWEAREAVARNKDVSPGHIMPDTAIVAAVKASPATVPALLSTPGFVGRYAKREAPRWLSALKSGAAAREYPPLRGEGTGVPHPKTWESKRPAAYERYQITRPRLTGAAESLGLPVENLLQPVVHRQLCWDASAEAGEAEIVRRLRDLGARPWQISVTAPLLVTSPGDVPPSSQSPDSRS